MPAKVWERRIEHITTELDDPEDRQDAEKFNLAACRIFKALPKSERRTFFEILDAAERLCTNKASIGRNG